MPCLLFGRGKIIGWSVGCLKMEQILNLTTYRALLPVIHIWASAYRTTYHARLWEMKEKDYQKPVNTLLCIVHIHRFAIKVSWGCVVCYRNLLQGTPWFIELDFYFRTNFKLKFVFCFPCWFGFLLYYYVCYTWDKTSWCTMKFMYSLSSTWALSICIFSFLYLISSNSGRVVSFVSMRRL